MSLVELHVIFNVLNGEEDISEDDMMSKYTVALWDVTVGGVAPSRMWFL